MAEWISVKDRLPEDFADVLIYAERPASKVLKGYYIHEYNHIRWYADGTYFYDDEVTHWMPLPEPPKGE